MPRASSLPLLALLCAACAPAKIVVHPNNILMFDKTGAPLDPADGQPPPGPAGDPTAQTLTLTAPKFHHHLGAESYILQMLRILDNAEKKGKLFIMVHGGMVAQPESVQDLDDYLQAGLGRDRDYYPVTINWHSDLWNSYWEHLWSVRNGERRPWIAPLTALPILVKDLLVGIARTPLVWSEQAYSYLNGENWFNRRYGYDTYGGIERLEKEYWACGVPPRAGCEALPFYTGRDKADGFGVEILRGLEGLLSFAPVAATSAFLNEGGQEAWRIMLRREQLLYESEASDARGQADGELPVTVRGDREADKLQETREALEKVGIDTATVRAKPLSAFFLLLQDRQRRLKDGHRPLQVVLACHSMGCIVVNDALRKFPDLEVSSVIYMASADSVLNYQNAAWPRLRRELARRRGAALEGMPTFHHVVLNDLAELRETNLSVPYFPLHFAPEGSLLVYIDSMLGQPNTILDRRAGRLSNLVATLDLTPPELKPFIRVRGFDALPDQDSRCQPQKHGSVRHFQFWEKEFYEPQPGAQRADCAPYAKDGK